jgi:hypothetical protein
MKQKKNCSQSRLQSTDALIQKNITNKESYKKIKGCDEDGTQY